MRPSKRLLAILFVWLFLAALLIPAGIYFPEAADWLSRVWLLSGGLLFLLALADAASRKFLNRLTARRQVPGSLSLGVSNPVKLCVENQNNYSVQFDITDRAPTQLQVQGLPVSLVLGAYNRDSNISDQNNNAEIHYHLRPLERGDASFGAIELRVTSRFGLWQFRHFIDAPADVKIYPNFTNISEFDLLGHDQQVNQMGIHLTQRRGQGMEFQQLREFRQGDVMRQVDWKATARYSKLISRQYQDERDQEIVVILDCGRRMRTKDGDLSHFDHALNAMLLLGYVALKQGDGLGFLSFGGQERWLPPQKGADKINVLLNKVYDLQSSTSASDLLAASQQLLERHRKRSLVVLISNLREEDSDQLLAAVQLLSKQHLVMVASLRENSLDSILTTRVDSFEQALDYSAATDFQLRRQNLLNKLQLRGASMIDSVPQQMHIKLVNEYLSLKRSGRI